MPQAIIRMAGQDCTNYKINRMNSACLEAASEEQIRTRRREKSDEIRSVGIRGRRSNALEGKILVADETGHHRYEHASTHRDQRVHCRCSRIPFHRRLQSGLMTTRQIGPAVAGDDCVENAKMISYRLSQCRIGSGNENNLPLTTLGTHPSDQIFVVGSVRTPRLMRFAISH
jgi:hypothetical protein